MFSLGICTVFLHLLAVFSIPKAQGEPVITDPLPTNIFAFETKTARVSCTVIDSTGAKPTKIEFVRKSKFGVDTIIPNSERRKYVNTTEDNGKRLTVELIIKNVTLQDDNSYGYYQCQGFVGSNKKGYGFSITVIPVSEVPGIQVSKSKVVNFGDTVVVSCNLTTKTPQSTELTKLLWTKDGKFLDEVVNPKAESMRSRVIKVESPYDVGLFTCQLISRIRDSLDYNVSDNIHITVKPYFSKDLKDNEFKIFKGDPAKFVCSAKGNPLKIYWKKMLRSDSEVSFLNASDVNSTGTAYIDRYVFSNLNNLEDHTMTINDVSYADRGLYYCCLQELPENINNTMQNTNVEGCQVFTLRVKDPLGALWPVIGIIIEVILLVIIIVLAEKFKKRKDQSTKANGRVEFSYSSTDDNADKGTVRLRPTAASTSESAEKA